jgi:protease-4
VNFLLKKILFSLYLLSAVNTSFSIVPDGVKKIFENYNIIKPLKKAENQCLRVEQILITGPIDWSFDSRLLSRLVELTNDSKTDAVLLIVNSDGGSGSMAETIYRELKKIKAKKPVVVFIPEACLSAAYGFSCCADKIISTERAEIGYIGVRCQINKIKNPKTENKEDFVPEFFIGGKNKAFEDPYSPELTPEQRENMQQQVNRAYEIFYSRVARERGLSLETKEQWADAKIFFAQEALDQHLIDAIGGYTDAQDAVKQVLRDRNILTDENGIVTFHGDLINEASSNAGFLIENAYKNGVRNCFVGYTTILLGIAAIYATEYYFRGK